MVAGDAVVTATAARRAPQRCHPLRRRCCWRYGRPRGTADDGSDDPSESHESSSGPHSSRSSPSSTRAKLELRETLELCTEAKGLIEFCKSELDAVSGQLKELKLDELVDELERPAGDADAVRAPRHPASIS